MTEEGKVSEIGELIAPYFFYPSFRRKYYNHFTVAIDLS